jgi:hypothetical protein
LAWHRSYWLLHDLPSGPVCSDVITIREQLLDELAQRDPAGFARWLHSGARASSEPSRYLTANRTDTTNIDIDIDTATDTGRIAPTP